MDYSVGSLADLISGSNTPNKPKVIQKAYKREIYDNIKSPSNNRSAKKNKFRKQTEESENASESAIESPYIKKNKLMKKKKGESPIKKGNMELEEGNNPQPIKKLKVKKVKLAGKLVGSNTESQKTNKNKKINLEASETTPDFVDDEGINPQPVKKRKVKKLKLTENDSIDNTAGQKTNKGKKRNLEASETSSDLVDDEESTPKKAKLTVSQQNAKRRVKKKINEAKRVHDPEETARTIFVGNMPIKIEKKKIEQHFKKYGKIETLRIRGISVAEPKTSKKVAAIKKEYNPNRNNVVWYIRYINKEDALKAEAENGALFEGHHLRVNCCGSVETPDETKAIFVGNLSFDAVEDDLWNLFEQCGPISHVRIIRDNYTGMGKGFAYVNFKDSDSVQLALEMENVKIKDRELRIKLSNLNVAKREKKFNKRKETAQLGKQRGRKNFNRNSDKETPGQNRNIGGPGRQKFRKNFNNNSDRGATAGQNDMPNGTNAAYQGAKFNDKKKKPKINKGLLEKKKMVKKIAPKLK